MLNILVIDDDASMRALLTTVLEVEGHVVRAAEDGFAGLRLVAAERPDCVVLDLMMPGMDGHAVLQRVRALDGGRGLPVVMLTAAADDEQAWRAWDRGVDYFLPKPFDPDELLRYLDSLSAGPVRAAG